jgi:hypothetical protein
MIRLRRFFFPLLLPFTFASDVGSIAAYDYYDPGQDFVPLILISSHLSAWFVALDRTTSEMEANIRCQISGTMVVKSRLADTQATSHITTSACS